MGRRIIVFDGAVAVCCENLVPVNDHCTDRNFATFTSAGGLFQRNVHERFLLIIVVSQHERSVCF